MDREEEFRNLIRRCAEEWQVTEAETADALRGELTGEHPPVAWYGYADGTTEVVVG